MNYKNCATFILIYFVLFVSAGIGEIITVGQDGGTSFSVIQEAIDAATDGDEIIVEIGTYFGSINFLGKNIILRSTNPQDFDVVTSTVMDGDEGSTPVVTFQGTEGTTCVLTGFNIRNAGSEINGLNLTIPFGAGINGKGTLATITHNFINRNRAGAGGGINDCDGLIANNRIHLNRALSRGGGLRLCDGVILNNIIDYNGVQATTNPFIPALGGGLSACNGYILHNTIFRNYVTSISNTNIGGGLYACIGQIRNNIILGNGYLDIEFSSTPTFSCIEDWSGGGEGNITIDPLLMNPDKNPHFPIFDIVSNEDYLLKTNSPCIDAGGVIDVLTDFSGTTRSLDAKSTFSFDGSNFDMGAFETLVTDEVIRQMILGTNFLQLISAQEIEADQDHDGTTDIVDIVKLIGDSHEL